MSTAQRPHLKVNISSVVTLAALTDVNTSGTFSATQIANATRAWVTAHDGDLIYLLNGQVPTATEGHIIKSETTTEIDEQINNLQLVSQSGTVNATVELSTYS